MAFTTSLLENRVFWAGAAALAVGVTGYYLSPHFSRNGYEATVTDTAVKRIDGEDRYLVFTRLPDGEVRVFQNADSYFELKFNSSDVQGQLEVGRTYSFATYGWRVPVFSWHENILSVSPVESTP